MISKLLFILIILVQCTSASAQPAQVIILRHAEKTEDPDNVHLSLKGQERAMALVPYLTQTPELITNGLPVALFAAGGHKPGQSQRPEETLQPLSRHLTQVIRTEFASKDFKSLARHVSTNPVFRNKTVVICWVHDYIPSLVEAFGVEKSSAKKWKSNSFDRLYLIQFKDNKPVFSDLPQRLLFGDSNR